MINNQITCPNCLRSNPAGTPVCYYCGSKILTIPAPVAKPSFAPYQQVDQDRAKANLAISSLILGTVAITGSLFCLLIGYSLNVPGLGPLMIYFSSFMGFPIAILAVVLGIIGLPTINRSFSTSGLIMGAIAILAFLTTVFIIHTSLSRRVSNPFPNPEINQGQGYTPDSN